MIQALVGKKIEQTQRFLTDGTRVPVTIISVTPNTVTQVKTLEKEGYSAVQVGFGTRKKSTKALTGHVKSAKLTASPRVFREVKLVDESVVPAVGDSITASDVLKVGDIIKVTGTGKGKGFQGGVKRHNFKGGPRTHGQSDRERAPGSIGQTTTPGRVYKGKRMAGHMGTDTVSVANLVVVAIDGEKVLVKGLVPGVLNATVYLQKTGELKSPLELYNDKPASTEADAPEEVVEEAAEAPVEEPVKEEVKEEAAEKVEEAAEATETKAEEKTEEVPAEAKADESSEAGSGSAGQKEEVKEEENGTK